MPRKPRYLSHNFNTQSPDNETLNKLQSPWFPFTYGSQIDGDQNSSVNTDSGQSSVSNSTYQDSSLQSKNGGHKRKPYAAVQNSAENHQHYTRNVKSHVQLPASQSILPNNGSTSVKLPTTSQDKMHIENCFCQSKNLHRKRKPPHLGGSDTQENESVARNIKQCLESHADACCDLHISSISSITNCHYANAPAEAQIGQQDMSVLTNNLQNDDTWYTLSMSNTISDQLSSPAEMPPSAHHTNKQYETSSLRNVHDLVHHVGSQYSDPSLHRKRPFSAQSLPLMANKATHAPVSVSDISHQERLSENRSPKRLRQHSGQTTRGKTGSRTHNVRQRLRADNSLNTFAFPPTPVVECPTVLLNPGDHLSSFIDIHASCKYPKSKNVQKQKSISAQSLPLMANKATHAPVSVSDISHQERLSENRSPKRLRQHSGQTTRGKTGGRTHNVRQRLGADNSLNTFASPPTLVVECPTILPNPGDHLSSFIDIHASCKYPKSKNVQKQKSISAQSLPLMANKATHAPVSVSDISHQQQLSENRSPKRLRQHSGQTTRGKTGGRTHNVRQRLRADNSLNTFASPPTPVVECPTVLPNPDGGRMVECEKQSPQQPPHAQPGRQLI